MKTNNRRHRSPTIKCAGAIRLSFGSTQTYYLYLISFVCFQPERKHPQKMIVTQLLVVVCWPVFPSIGLQSWFRSCCSLLLPASVLWVEQSWHWRWQQTLLLWTILPGTNTVWVFSINIMDEVKTRDIELCNFCGESLEFYDNVARCLCRWWQTA